MKILTSQEHISISGGVNYGTCEVLRDGTVGFFTAAGSLLGGATTFGLGATFGGFFGHMAGSAIGDIVYQDCKGV